MWKGIKRAALKTTGEEGSQGARESTGRGTKGTSLKRRGGASNLPGDNKQGKPGRGAKGGEEAREGAVHKREGRADRTVMVASDRTAMLYWRYSCQCEVE